MKIVFMGTPEFAATILDNIIQAGHEVVSVYTQPDRPKGRSGKPVASPVKELAESKGITVYQPERIKRPEEVELLKTFDAEVFVVAAYGQIVSREILDIPKICSINAHGSLLPKLRGASPIQRAIANGDSETGITVMRMDEGVDTGDIILSEAISILPEDDEASMYEKLAVLGGKLIVEALDLLSKGEATFTKQDDNLSTHAPMLKKEEGLLDFNKTAWELDCIVRGFKEWPTAYTYVGGKGLKVFKAKATAFPENYQGETAPGSFYVTKKNIYIVAKDGLLELLEVQPEGKKRMAAMDFSRGQHIDNSFRVDNT